MYPHNLDHIAENLQQRVKERDAFVAKHGLKAGGFLDELPALFQLYRRVPFDPDIPVEARRIASSAALYIAEHADYLGDHHSADGGLIDDLWLAFRALPMLVKRAGGPALARHWRGDTSLDEVQGMAANVSAIADKVPSKVLEAAQRFLDVES